VTAGLFDPHGSATEIARAVRAGDRTATEVVEEHLARIAEREEELHAFNIVLADEARTAAARVDEVVSAGGDPGPLAGVPVAVKDNLCTRGIPTTCSSRILEHWVPPYDATVVSRLAASGAVVVGKTNLDEFAMGSSTENSAFGPTRNPHDPTRVPGGSSGGSAAAVAAGFAPLALGSDTGGSIRQPAALCGVVGAKPTYGMVSRYGLIAFASSLDQIGPLAADVADAALLLEVIAGHDPADSTSIRERSPRSGGRSGPGIGDLRGAVDEGVDGLRIGVVTELAEGANPDVAARLDEAVQALEAAGAKVDETSVPATAHGLSAYYLLAPAEASSNLARYDGVRYGLRVDGADLRPVGRLLRRVLRPGPAGAHSDHPRFRGRLCRPRPPAVTHRSDDCLRPRGQDRRSPHHVPVRRVHHPLQPGRPPGCVGALRHR